MPSSTYGEVRSYAARFLFTQEEVEKDVAVLSGGEAGRLALALLFLDRPNFLVLDEPTNHLDIDGRAALEEALSSFPGTILLVSHDRYLLECVADRIVEIRPDEVIRTDGSWSDHVRMKRERAKAAGAESPRRPRAKPSERGGAKKPNAYRLARLEERIIEIEERLAVIRVDMTREEVYRDADRIRALQFELGRLTEELDTRNAEWEGMIGG
jgi:ATP-binding cassette subfamily F protein 3